MRSTNDVAPGAAPAPQKPTILLVLGMHRSGTSALTRTINLLGADLPQGLIPASTTSNPAGHWESREVQELNDRVLHSLGSHWDDWRALDPQVQRSADLDTERAQALDILQRDAGGSLLFALKDPRICRLLPFWLTVIERFGADLSCVLAWREPAAVAASLARRNHFNTARSRLLWLQHVLEAEHASRGLRRTLVSYEELLSDWRGIARRLAADLDIDWPPPTAAAQHEIDRFLSRPDAPRPVLNTEQREHDPDWAEEVHQLLREAHSSADLDALGDRLDRIRSEFARAGRMFAHTASAACTADTEERSELKQTLSTSRRYIHALENAARIRDVQLADGKAQLEQADGCIDALNQLLRERRTDDGGQEERLRALHLELLRQRRALLHSRPAHAPPPARNPLGQRLSRRERSELRARARRLLETGLFDTSWYLQSSPDVWAAGVDPVWHWLLSGWREGRMPNPLFDTSWYLEAYPDAVASGLDPLSHYLHDGASRGHNPGPLFSHAWYLEHNPDVGAAGADPLLHWLSCGNGEGRPPSPWFDPPWYLDENPDVAASGLPALEHFLLAGGQEGRDPCPGFSSRWYLAHYRDVHGNPLMHFLKHGMAEHRQPLPPPSAYRAGQTPDGIFDPSSSFSIALNVTEQMTTCARGLVGTTGAGRFSVIVPTWNRRQSLSAAVDSVLNQSYGDWELLICDDGSTDGTEADMRSRYGQQIAAGRIRYLALQHRGVAAARNAGLEAAHGDWIAYLDSDNTWHPHYLLMMAAGFAGHPERRSAYACLRVKNEVQDRDYVRYSPFHYGKLLAHNFIDLNVFTHHRSLYKQLDGFDESLRRLVDWDLILRYAKTYEPLLIPHVLCDYRIAESLRNISLIEALADNEARIRRKHARDVAASGSAPLRLAYVVAAWPASSVVQAELDALCRLALDVRVYSCGRSQTAVADPRAIPATPVTSIEDLVRLLESDQRNWIHCASADTETCVLAASAAEQAGMAYSLGLSTPCDADVSGAALADAARNDLCAGLLVAKDSTLAGLEVTFSGRVLIHPEGEAVQALLDCCARFPVDVFTVTQLGDNTEEALSKAERAIRSVLDHTSTPMVLTVLDDGSPPAALQKLAAIIAGDARVRLLPLHGRHGFAYCANLALSLARSDYVFHVSSTSEYVIRAGWEQACLKTMRAHPEYAAGGPLVYSTSVPDNKSLMRQSWFSLCRHPGFARRHPEQQLRQLHAGLFVVRRSVFERQGGFNEAVPEPRCQLEYSYFLQSQGYRIGSIGELHTLAHDTPPELDPRLDETILALDCADQIAPPAGWHCLLAGSNRCNICGWCGQASLQHDGVGFDCPACGSSPRDRATLYWLTGSAVAVGARGLSLDARGLGEAVRRRLEPFFLLREGPAQIEVPARVPAPASRMLGVPPAAVSGKVEPACNAVD